MTFQINTVQAKPDGSFLVNSGTPEEASVQIDPSKNDPNASALLTWLRTNEADSWQEPPLVLAEARAAGLAAVVAFQEAQLSVFTVGYSTQELLSWPTKAEAARNFGTPAATPAQTKMINDEALAAGLDPATLAATIIGLADVRTELISKASGIRQLAGTSIAAAADQAGVDAAVAIAEASLLASITAVAG